MAFDPQTLHLPKQLALRDLRIPSAVSLIGLALLPFWFIAGLTALCIGFCIAAGLVLTLAHEETVAMREAQRAASAARNPR